MKNVLTVGENSYIGESFAKYANKRFNITTIDAKDGKWREIDFSKFDAVLHCAGIAHVKQKRSMKALYYSVNCDLAVDVAKHAKANGVGQFIFLSSMSVYGKRQGVINNKTEPNATDFYGGSKLKAEKLLQTLETEAFKICIARPPMVYGYGCKGNFGRLVKLAKKAPVFPNIENRRSMIYINNLCEFFCLAIEKEKSGIHLPQNAKYVNITEMVVAIAKFYGREIRLTSLFNPLVKLLAKRTTMVGKLFGDLVYAKSVDATEYYVVGVKESIGASLMR